MKNWEKERDGDIGRTPEDRMLICKVLQHTIDYCLAVKHYGQDFYKHPCPGRSYKDNGVYDNGLLAHWYFFEKDDDDYGLEKMCENFGWNAPAMRKRMAEMTPEQAATYGHFYARYVSGLRKRKKDETADTKTD